MGNLRAAIPGPGGRWQISGGDGVFARWSPTGRQLFYATSQGQILVTDYEIRDGAFLAGKPRVWTDTRISVNIGRPTLDLTPDGRLLLTSINPAEAAQQSGSVYITMLLNFFDELKRRLP